MGLKERFYWNKGFSSIIWNLSTCLLWFLCFPLQIMWDYTRQKNCIPSTNNRTAYLIIVINYNLPHPSSFRTFSLQVQRAMHTCKFVTHITTGLSCPKTDHSQLCRDMMHCLITTRKSFNSMADSQVKKFTQPYHVVDLVFKLLFRTWTRPSRSPIPWSKVRIPSENERREVQFNSCEIQWTEFIAVIDFFLPLSTKRLYPETAFSRSGWQ